MHLIPFAGLVLLAMPFYALSGPEKITVIQNSGAGYEWYRVVQLTVILLSGLLYGAASLALIKKSRAQMGELFSNTDHKSLRWLEYLSLGLAVIWVLVMFFDDAVIFSGAAALVILIGVFGINQLPIFTAAPDLHASFPPAPAAENNLTRYAKSGLKPAEAEQLYQRLTGKITGEALFKNNDLTLTELAVLLDVHPNYLSQVINAREGKNFYNYVNTLRAREFVRLIALPEKRHFTLLALANECGFNSKSTFNKYVKLVCGKTPSELFEKINT